MNNRHINDEMTPEQVDVEIAKKLGWKNIRKSKNDSGHSGINPLNNLREPVPPFSKCPNAIHIAENYVAQTVGMNYILYLARVKSQDEPASWANVQEAFLDPFTRAKACLNAMNDIGRPKNLTRVS